MSIILISLIITCIFFAVLLLSTLFLWSLPANSPVTSFTHRVEGLSPSELIFNESASNNLDGNTPLADYTLLVYIIGSDLENKSYAATNDILEMQKAVDTSSMNVVLQTGGGGGEIHDKRFIDFSRTQRSLISNGTTHTLMDLNKANMGESKTLSDFIIWGISKYPAKKYAIFFWDHGSGLNGFGNDLNYNDILTPYELQVAFQKSTFVTQKNFELIGFDACLMASLEILNHVNSYGNYMIFSEELEPSWGWNYTAILDRLNSSPEMDGRSLGRIIVDSYKQYSERTSEVANRSITMSVIDLNVVPELVNRTIELADAMGKQITDLNSATLFSRIVDSTERYGQSVNGTSGLVDMYDLTINLENSFPSLSREIKALQQSISKAVIYNLKSDSKINAHGISIYMPLQKSEFVSLLNGSNFADIFSILPWEKIAFTQYSIISNDLTEPRIKSTTEKNEINLRTDSIDISTVVADIATNSTRGPMLIYRQYIDPSKIDSNGFLTYSEHNMLSLCNSQTCIPTSMKLETNRDKKFVMIPVRIQSEADNINENVSLIYEMNNGKFVFLGASPEINPNGAVPKIELSLKPGYKIYTKALSQYPFQVSKNLAASIKSTSKLVDDGSLLVDSGEAILPKFVSIKLPFAITFTFCDYSDNCYGSRWYTFRVSYDGSSQIQPDYELNHMQNGEARQCTEIPSTIGTCQYANGIYGFKLQYPQNWDLRSQNVCDNSSYSFDTLSDPTILRLSPKDKLRNTGSPYESAITIDMNDSPFRKSVKAYFDFLKSPSARDIFPGTYQITQLKSRSINGNPAFEFVLKYNSSAEEKLDVSKERTEKFLTLLMDNKLYNLVLQGYSTEFSKYLPAFENIVSSLSKYTNNKGHDSLNDNGQQSKIFSNQCNMEINKHGSANHSENGNLFENITYSTLSDTKYNYTIEYPTNIGFGKPIELNKFDPSGTISGYYFVLNDNTQSLNDRGMVSIMIESFGKDEVRKMEQNPDLMSVPSPFDINGLKAAIENKVSQDKLDTVGYHLLDEQVLSVKGNPSLTTEYTYFNPVVKDTTQDKIVYTIIGNQMFLFHFTSDPKTYLYFIPIFDRMMDSLEVEPE